MSDHERFVNLPYMSSISADKDPTINEMEDQTWKTNLIKSLHNAWKDGLHTDLTIITEDDTFRVHKILLTIASPYFKALLSSGFAESSTSVLNLEYIEGKVMNIILTYVYSGKVNLTEKVATEVLVWADYFQIYELKRLCCTYIINNITSYSYLSIYELSLKHNCLDLASFAMKKASDACSEMFSDSSFLSAQPSTILTLLKNPILNVYSEDELLSALKQWVNHKRQEREACYPYILASINELQLSSEGQSMYQEEMSNYLELDAVKEIDGVLHEPSILRFKKGEKLLFVIGGESCGRILSNVECSSAEKLSWRCSLPLSNEPKGINYMEGQEVVRSMKYPRSHAAVANKNNIIYVIGGRTTQDLLSSCETYHIENNEWREFPSLPYPLHGAQSVVLEDKLWVIGGASSGQKSKEGRLLEFDDIQNEWIAKTSMLKGRVHFAAAVAYGCLYVFGGVSVDKNDDGRILNSCEKYDVDADQWIPIAPLGRGRSYHGVAVINDLIYVMGGYSGTKWLDSVECYDPLADRWTTVSPMIGCRSSFGVVSWNKRIYCFGGFNGESTLSTVLKYNPKTDMWHGEHNMHFKRYGLMVATVTLPYNRPNSI